MKRPAAAPYTKEIATMIAVVVSNKEATSRSERGAMGLGVDDLEVEVDNLEVVEEGVVRLLDVVDIFVGSGSGLNSPAQWHHGRG